MSVKKINTLFKSIIIILGLSGANLLLFVAPKISNYLEGSSTNLIIQFLFWLTAIPVFYILTSLWKISSDLGKNQMFTQKNSQRLVKIAYAGLVESSIYAIATIIGLFLFKGNYPYLLICFFFFFLGLVIAIISSLLSYIFEMASQLKDENDLTI